ncbi:ribonuclease inhibitor-like isoform X2 [Petromyzon marinus]|uniref:ribonuclease inhibitor-like isoform X2 n=1 Tax=Petromyzon marinus TaxID=7757 RepID=UPI003F72CA27
MASKDPAYEIIKTNEVNLQKYLQAKSSEVLDHSYQTGIVLDSEYTSLNSENDPVVQTRRLVNLVLIKGEQVCMIFLEDVLVRLRSEIPLLDQWISQHEQQLNVIGVDLSRTAGKAIPGAASHCAALSWILMHREEPMETLNLWGCGIGTEEMKRLQRGLHRCKELVLSENEIRDSGLRLLADGMLEREGSLETLELYRCLLMDKSGSSLSVILKANKGLKNLGLTLNEIGDSGLRLLADGMLEREGSLETLELYRCLLMDKSGSSLSVILKANKGLKNLGLTLNEIGDSGLRLLADGMLEREGSLETLELYRCLLMDKSGSSLSVILKANKGLKNLGLTLNEIGDSGLRLLADGMLEREGSLETLELYRCLLMDKSGSSLSVILKANKGLKNLGLTLNEIGDSGLRLLADGMLEREGSLETLEPSTYPLYPHEQSLLSLQPASLSTDRQVGFLSQCHPQHRFEDSQAELQQDRRQRTPAYSGRDV